MNAEILLTCLVFGLSAFLLTPKLYFWSSQIVTYFERHVEQILSEMFMFDITPRSVTLTASAFMSFCVIMFFLILPGLVGIVLGVVLGVAVPLFVIYQIAKRRRAKLEVQLVDALITLANGMRAGLNLGQAMALIEQHGEKPCSQEFGLIIREVEHGTSIDQALDNASRRLKSHNYRLLFAAMKTTRLRGGNMPVTLDRLSESLRNIIQLEEKVKAQTAQGKTSALMMGIMPLVVLGIYYLIDSHGVTLLFTEPIGQVVLFLGLIMNIAGFLWIRRIVSFEV